MSLHHHRRPRARPVKSSQYLSVPGMRGPSSSEEYDPRLPGILQYPNDNLIASNTDRGQYTEISIAIPPAPTPDPPIIYQLPELQWRNQSYCCSSERSRAAAVDMMTNEVINSNIQDRAIARFAMFVTQYRLHPLDSTLLSFNEQWIPPRPFTKVEEKTADLCSTLFIPWENIDGAYYPETYQGLRQAFILNKEIYRGKLICKAQRVILGNVVGDNVAYRVTRIRFIACGVAGIEVVGITADGLYHGETSLGWPPFLIEIPTINVLQTSFGPSGR